MLFIVMGISLLIRPAIISSTEQQISACLIQQSLVCKRCGELVVKSKSFIALFALLPPFIHPNLQFSATAQILSLGIIHLISCAIVCVLVGIAAKKLLCTRPQAVKIVSRISGA